MHFNAVFASFSHKEPFDLVHLCMHEFDDKLTFIMCYYFFLTVRFSILLFEKYNSWYNTYFCVWPKLAFYEQLLCCFISSKSPLQTRIWFVLFRNVHMIISHMTSFFPQCQNNERCQCLDDQWAPPKLHLCSKPCSLLFTAPTRFSPS